MVQSGMTTPYTAFAQQNGAAGDTTPLKPDMKAVEGGPPGGGGGGGSPNGVTAQQALQALTAQHANGVVDQQQNATVRLIFLKLYTGCSNISKKSNFDVIVGQIGQISRIKVFS